MSRLKMGSRTLLRHDGGVDRNAVWQSIDVERRALVDDLAQVEESRWSTTTSTARSCGVASRARFDESIHAPTRLRLCALLRPVDHIDFSVLATTLGLSDANLSKTVRALVDLGYISTTKEASTTRRDVGRTTRIALTPAGRAAIDGHLAALQGLASVKGAGLTTTDG